MRKMRQGLAALLCVAMLFTMDGPTIHAATVTEQGETTVTSQNVTDEEATGASADTTTLGTTSAETAATEAASTETVSTETVKTVVSTETTSTETASTETASTEMASTETASTENAQTAEQLAKQQAVQSNMLLSYLAFGSSYLETPGEQYALVGMGDGTYPITSATLHYKNYTTGAEYSVNADTIDTDSALFYMNFADQSFTGCYGATSIDYVADGIAGTIQIADTGITARFGVNQEVDSKPDAEIIDQEDAQDANSVVITDSTGQEMTTSEFADAVENASTGISSTGDTDATGAGNLVIVLDPGHGGTDSGAAYYGLQEKNLNLAIATYCKAELETYNGVTVYMTRTTDSTVGTPYDQASSLDTRVAIAKNYGANVLISFHINASTNTSANGVTVYYPNTNYNATIGNIGNVLANKIQAKLVALGIKNNGATIWNASETTYPDGSLGDYLGLIRRAKNVGIPCVLIEHAYLSNSSDVSNFLNSPDKLKALGVADATGIAEYYGLTKGVTAPTWNYVTSSSSTALKLSWQQVSGANGYYLYRATSAGGKYSKIATISSGTTLSYTDKNLQTGQPYYYKMKFYTSAGASSESSVMGAIPVGKNSVTSVKSYGSGKLKVSWSQASGATGYLLYRSTSLNGSYARIATISSGSTLSYTDSGLSTGTTYFYKVKVGTTQNGKIGYGDASEAVSGWSIAATKITGVNATDTGDLKIKWKAVSNAYQYQVYRSTSKDGSYTKLATVSATTYTDTSVKSNQVYYYKVRVRNLNAGVKGLSDYSSIKSGIQIGRTTILYVQSKSSSSLKVAWKAISGATGYNIYRASSQSGDYTQIATVGSETTNYTDKGLQTGQNYYYKIQVLNQVGSYKGCSQYSKVLSGQPIGKTKISYVQSYNSTKLKLAWNKVDGATGYIIKRSTSKNGTYEEIKTITSGSTTSYKNSGLQPGKTYYYKVETVNSNNGITGYSGYSSAVGGKTVNPTTISKTKAVSTAAIQITWAKVSGASGYQIYRSTSSNGSYAKVGEVASGSTVTYNDTPPKANTKYYYKVRSLNSNNGKTGYGDYSPAVYGKSVAVPVNLSITLTNTGKLQLNWSKVSGAVSYRIYRMASNGAGYSKLTDIPSGSTVTYTDGDVTSGITYSYTVLAYNKVNGVTGYSGQSAAISYNIAYYEIMGATSATVTQMVNCFNATGYAYPSGVYASKGAGDIATFATIVCQEANAEGVKAEVLWAQIILETGWLQFSGSMVSADKCNFGGLGALDNSGGSYVASFPDVRTGIRAQVQHLKAYASTATLSNACVDTRFSLVKRGCAIYVEWLGQQENPLGYGWATGANYGNKIRSLINRTKGY